MEKPSRRLKRRFHLKRMKERSKRIWRENGNADSDHPIKVANHMKSCSCEMCCNPRRSVLFNPKEKLTIHERKQNERDKESMKELNDED